MLLGVASQIRVNRLVPEFLDTVPVLYLSALQEPIKLVSLAARLGLFTYIEVKLRVVEQVLFTNSSLL